MANAKEIDKADAPQLYNVVEEMAIAAGVPMPKVMVLETDALNAFATGNKVGQRHHRGDARPAEHAQPRRAAGRGGARDVPSRQPRHALHGGGRRHGRPDRAGLRHAAAQPGLGRVGSRSSSSDKKGGGARHPHHPADRRGHPGADRRQVRADGGVAPARVSCRRHVGAVHAQSQRTDLGAGQARREGRALSRSESCHAASLHRQSGADLHRPRARRCWPRIPTLPIASLACAIWALSLRRRRGLRPAGPSRRARPRAGEHAGRPSAPRSISASPRSRPISPSPRTTSWSSATTRCSIPT